MLQFIQDYHDKIKGWRTIIWGFISMIPWLYLTFFDGFRDLGIDLTPIISISGLQEYTPFIGIVSAFITIYFRIITKGKVGDQSAYDQH